jgi:hypothetical protein
MVLKGIAELSAKKDKKFLLGIKNAKQKYA